MRLARRNFLGLLAGGAAAGPSVASSLAEEMAHMSIEDQLQPLDMPALTKEAHNSGKWRRDRINSLRLWLSGQDPEEEDARRETIIRWRDSRERARLEGLRSISGSHKALMKRESEWRENREVKRLEWGRELARHILTGGK